MRKYRVPGLGLLVAVVVGLALLVGSAGSSGAASSGRSTGPTGSAAVTRLPVSFQVRNVNRSAVPCAADGRTYTVRGHLVGPGWALAAGRVDAGTLYLHGLGFGEFFWDFDQAAGYDYSAAQARAGHVSVVIDRLGYGSSDKPAGTKVCVGSQADVAHQMVQQLRRGAYRVTGAGPGPAFAHVALAGHSYGGLTAQVEAYSFGDIDALAVIGFADTGMSAVAQRAGAATAKVCAAGGLRVGGTGPSGYAPFGDPAQAKAAFFHSVDPAVFAAARQALSIDPCGDSGSIMAASKADLARVKQIRVPVLVVAGGADALFPRPAGDRQAARYTGARSVELVTLPATAHAISLETTHHRFAAAMASWLDRHGRG